ncbi:uncharacterized protein MELLADRAFT_89841 [Melampsora larici-populina 98AG31]|uniref:Choline kinase N-terminal domain-containing protein n=1 Tax=Melampsora larici-populina (strain 98AG31 / pathotype 3-4-7) TaxID=747676 RepID=F4RUT8_MELLP|nr:uncharacterized protein MELLADRAFT_89841 [Melampsora larici-populina 98AG31]EGG03867.1 hypothetical protein MELLADRAFT_89841 [Melampsora larici-populina 98AG31]
MSTVQVDLPPSSTSTTTTTTFELQPTTYTNPDKDDHLTEIDDDDDDEEDEPEDYTSHSVHAEGVPRCETNLIARHHRSNEFAQSVFKMLQFELKLHGWNTLPDSAQSSISIYKVGGSLTNAVFFVSCPINSESSESNSKVNDLKDSNSSSPYTPPPTVLLRIYGPSSGSLISRKHELHLLHTLSVQYSIAPLVLGTFHNGRVEEYFESRPLTKEEIRDPKISRWIAYRMKELHSVDLRIISRRDEERSSSTLSNRSIFPRSQSLNRQAISQKSILISSGPPQPGPLSSQQTSMSWSSSYSSGSDVSSVQLPFTDRLAISSPGTYPTVLPSPLSTFSRDPYFIRKKHSKDSSRSSSTNSLMKSDKIKVGAWENIIRWQREAEKVVQQIHKFSRDHHQLDIINNTPRASKSRNHKTELPLSSLKTLVEFVDDFDLPRLIRETKAYRNWVRKSEKLNGKSLRVFSHNDTQCGNLLLRQLDEVSVKERAHEQILVIDFEYASANPRAFDIANHFHEWCADYHHPTLSYSLSEHGNYPTETERKTFYKAYLSTERITHLSLDGNLPEDNQAEEERIKKLEEEVKIWSPASHVMWSLWGLVQAQDDIKDRMEKWKSEEDEDQIEEGKGLSDLEFDYLSFSLERIGSFRKMLCELGVVDEVGVVEKEE